MEYLPKVLIAILCGGIIGIEREQKKKSAGFRTYTLVSLGACLSMILALNISKDTGIGDVARLPAGIMQSIGFLGAGVIMFSAKDETMHGLTTAADLWCTTVIGLIIGYGLYLLAIVATIFMWIINHWFAFIPKTIFNFLSFHNKNKKNKKKN